MNLVCLLRAAAAPLPGSLLMRWSVVVASFALTLATPVTAQDSASFGETVDVQRINVEVWVTDRDGNAITGLTRDDFEVFEDGKTVEISNFSEIRASLPGDPFAPSEGVAAAIEQPTREPTLELEDLLQEDPERDQQSGFLVLYFDQLFTGITGREQLVEDLRTFMDLGRIPAAKILVLSQDEHLRVEANLGSSRAELEAAIDRMAKSSPKGVQTWADERNAIRRLQADWERVAVLGNTAPGQNPCDFFVGEAFREVQLHIANSQPRVQTTLEHLANTAGFLAGLPGPKTLIYISDGLPTTPGKDLLSFVKHVCPAQTIERRLDHEDGMNAAFRDLSRHANANRVTIYTLQALGLRQASSLTSADQRGVRGTIQALRRYDSESRTQNRGGLLYLAGQTGGRAIINRGAFIEELEQIGEDMNSYYSLAYAPPHGGDGLEHSIKVKVKGDGLRVRHRPGYRDKNADQRMVERLESALYLNLMANPLGVTLGAGTVQTAGKDTYKIPLHVRLPVDNVTYLPGSTGDHAQIRVQVLARDERNVRAAFKQEQYDLPRPEGTEEGQQFSLLFELELKQGIHVVAFGVRDEATQEASFVATGLEIQPPPTGSGP
ncbi:MAG: VWA domain-containing protein [Acidobacteriota bacterium]